MGVLYVQSCQTLCDPHGAHEAPLSMEFSGKNTGVSCHFLLQGTLPEPGIEPASPTLASRCFTAAPPGKPF